MLIDVVIGFIKTLADLRIDYFQKHVKKSEII